MKLNDERIEEPTKSERLALDLVRIPLTTPTLPPATRTNSFLVQGDSGWFVVDIGPSDSQRLDTLRGAIDQYVPSGELSGLILTHHHPDHVGGLRWFVERFDVPVISGEATWERHHHNIDQEWRVITGDMVDVDGLTLVETSGHAPDHYSILTLSGDLVAGDIISGMGTIVIAPPDGDMDDYYRSLEKLIGMDFSSIHPAHGPSSDEPRMRLKAYLEHRRAREQRVKSALSTTEARDIDDLVAKAYADVDSSLHAFARGTLRAYLNMMRKRQEVDVSEDGLRWVLRS